MTDDRLGELRRRIDSIDDRIQDLLIERTEIVTDIAQIKQKDSAQAYRPGREAAVVRRLLERHHGDFPKSVIVRLWRELLGATTRLQGDFAVAVYRTAEASAYWDLAREHFGNSLQLKAFSSEGQVIAAVAERSMAAGVVPLPQHDDVSPWWSNLLRDSDDGLQVVARLPFAAAERQQIFEALVIGGSADEQTDDDRSLIAIEVEPAISRARLWDELSKLDLAPSLLVADDAAARIGSSLHLADLPGFILADDKRFENLPTMSDQRSNRITRIGGYAAPLRQEDLAS